MSTQTHIHTKYNVSRNKCDHKGNKIYNEDTETTYNVQTFIYELGNIYYNE